MIKFLEYEGKKYPVRVSYYAIKMLKEDIGRSLIGMADDDFEAQELLLYYSLKMGARKTGEEFTLTKLDMENMMDEVYMDFMKIIPEFFPKNEQAKVKGGKSQVEKK